MERISILKDLGCRLVLKLLNYLRYYLQVSLATPTEIVSVNSDFGFGDLVSPHSGKGSHLTWQAMRQRDRDGSENRRGRHESSAAAVCKHLLRSRCKVKMPESFSNPGTLGFSERMHARRWAAQHSGVLGALAGHRENGGEVFLPERRLRGNSGRT